MANWKKVIVSGSSAELSTLQVDNLVSGVVTGDITGSLTTTPINGSGSIVATTDASGLSHSGSFSGSFEGSFIGDGSQLTGLNVSAGIYKYTGSLNNSIVPLSGSNTSDGDFSTVGGGTGNTSLGQESTIGGGGLNNASGSYSTVAGGRNNTAGAFESTIGGGGFNTATGDHSTIGGGLSNIVGGITSVIAGGTGNETTKIGSTIAGGSLNYITGDYGAILGGNNNFVAGDYSVIAGGLNNTVRGLESGILGGVGNTIEATHTGSFIIGNNITSNASNTTFVNNLNVSSDAIITGNLTVNGTTTTINTDNLLIEDKFALFASGSTTSTDGGIIIQNDVAGTGYGFGYKSSTNRWVLEDNISGSTTSFSNTPTAYIASTQYGLANDKPSDITGPSYGGTSSGYGNIWVSTDTSDIWIYA
jgi:hypothetical protein